MFIKKYVEKVKNIVPKSANLNNSKYRFGKHEPNGLLFHMCSASVLKVYLNNVQMKQFFSLAILLLTLTACNNSDETPKQLVEPQLFLNAGDKIISYNYQLDNRINYFHYKDSNPDSVIVEYRIEFSGTPSYLQLTFFETFLIEDLDNEVSPNFPSDYALSEREMLKVFEKGRHSIVDHEVNLIGPLVVRPSNGTNIQHFRFLSYDSNQGINIFDEFGSAENEGNHFEINEITKLTLDNHQRGTQDSDLTPSLFKVYNTVYAITGSFDVNMYDKSVPDSEKLKSPEFTFVVYTDIKEEYRSN